MGGFTVITKNIVMVKICESYVREECARQDGHDRMCVSGCVREFVERCLRDCRNLKNQKSASMRVNMGAIIYQCEIVIMK